PLVVENVILGPGREAVAAFTLRVFYARSWINLDVAGVQRPAKQSAQRVEKVARLIRRFNSALISPLDDLVARDHGDRQVTDIFDDVQKDIVALSARRRRKILLPDRGFAIACDQPSNCTRLLIVALRLGARFSGEGRLKLRFELPRTVFRAQ